MLIVQNRYMPFQKQKKHFERNQSTLVTDWKTDLYIDGKTTNKDEA